MNYDLTKTVQGKNEFDLDQAMPFGDMPPSMLMTKFEETDMGVEEDLYENYARTTLTDYTADKNKFEHEEARGGVDRRAGRLELQYYGHRGVADDPYRPEYFDAFIGAEDRDPRGINVDPDFKQLVRQEDARMRFVRWDQDGSDQITGLGRSESQLMADQQKLYRTVRDRLKVFDRQIDGRREGMRREYRHKSNIPKQVLIQSYGDTIRDYALNPQKRSNLICKGLLRASRAWCDETCDSDFAFAKYAQICRRARARGGASSVIKSTDVDADMKSEEGAKHYHAIGLLMSNIVKYKRQICANMRASDVDLPDVKSTIARKSRPFTKDLNILLHAIAQDAAFAHSDVTARGKNPAPQYGQFGKDTLYTHSVPAHNYLNAEILYKSVRPGADLRKIKDYVITDMRAGTMLDTGRPINAKAAKMKLVSGARHATADDSDKSESVKTPNYKTKLQASNSARARDVANDGSPGESDNSQNRRPNHVNYRVHSVDDQVDTMQYGNNFCKERRMRGIGNKYMTRYIDREDSGTIICA